MIELLPEIVRSQSNPRRFRRFIGQPDSNGCWPWLGAIKKKSRYGTFGLLVKPGEWKKTALAHRVSYVLFVGPIPDGLELDHTCRNRACVNPAHLEPATHKVNCLRGISPWANNARKTTCPKGHPLSGENLKFDKAGDRVLRRCRICANAAVSRHWFNLPEAERARRIAAKVEYNRKRNQKL